MAHAIWSGTISFGLVTIPVKLFTAVRESDGDRVHFHMLHKADEGRIHFARKCSTCGKEVPYADIVKGFEYQKGEYVVVTDDEVKRYRPEATQSIDIVEFVEAEQINPMLYEKPYFLEPEKKGRKAYALLRSALEKSGRVGIAKVVLRTREYLAALKPTGDALVLETMHFASELVSSDTLELPKASEKEPGEGEMKAAMMLIDAMTTDFDAEKFHDEYQDELRKMLEARAEGAPPPSKEKATPEKENVVDLMDVLQKSLAANKNTARKAAGAKDEASPKHKEATAHHAGHAPDEHPQARHHAGDGETKGPAKARSHEARGKRKAG